MMKMKEKVLFVILDNYSDREYPLLADALQFGIEGKESLYEVKTLSVRKKIIHSIGGFATVPDYGLEDITFDYAGIVLIGGYSWQTDEAGRLAGLIKDAYKKGKVVAAICKATEYLGTIGLLNHRNHTSNTLQNLKKIAGDNYTGETYYRVAQAVRDGNLVTANGTALLEFTKEVLLALNAYSLEMIERYCKLYQEGYIEYAKKMGNIQIFK